MKSISSLSMLSMATSINFPHLLQWVLLYSRLVFSRISPYWPCFLISFFFMCLLATKTWFSTFLFCTQNTRSTISHDNRLIQLLVREGYRKASFLSRSKHKWLNQVSDFSILEVGVFNEEEQFKVKGTLWYVFVSNLEFGVISFYVCLIHAFSVKLSIKVVTLWVSSVHCYKQWKMKRRTSKSVGLNKVIMWFRRSKGWIVASLFSQNLINA